MAFRYILGVGTWQGTICWGLAVHARWRRREISGPKSKWGRHCCRPHSYPRVAFRRRTWRPMFRVPFAPYPKMWAFIGVVTGARAGIRFLPVPAPIRRSLPSPFGSETVQSLMARFLKRSCICRSFCNPSTPDRIDRPIVALLSRSDHRFSQLRAETLCEKSYWTAWTDATTSNWFEFSTDFRSLNHLSEKLSRLSDDLRLLLIAESGKRLIHCKRIQRWTGVDNSTLRRRSYRSRWASSRRRRALSLMKPSASCWS